VPELVPDGLDAPGVAAGAEVAPKIGPAEAADADAGAGVDVGEGDGDGEEAGDGEVGLLL